MSDDTQTDQTGSTDSKQSADSITPDTSAGAPTASAAPAKRVAAKRTTKKPEPEIPDELAGAEDFVVVHPAMNIYIGQDDTTVTLSDGSTADVVDGWAVVTKGTRLKATSAAELADYRMKVDLGFLTAVPAAS